MPYQELPALDLKYALITFDDRGRERADDPDGGVFSTAILAHLVDAAPSHVFLFSHGWMGDVPSAVDQYNRWIAAMWQRQVDRAAFGSAFRPLFIGLHWPSRPWGEEAQPPAASFAARGAVALDAIVESAVAHFGATADVRTSLDVIFRAYAQDPAARILSDAVVSAYADLAHAIGFTGGAGPGAAPDEDGVALDPQAAVRAERIASAGESFGIASSLRNGILAGLRQASFWLMKHRARTVGEQGMHQFVAALQHASPASIHLMGHSFGSVVISSILGGPGGTGSLPRAVQSAALVQGALSLWSFADVIPGEAAPGYFTRVLKGAVSGPIVTTQSRRDSAVGLAYPAAVGLVNEFDFGAALPKFGGVGTWGIQGTPIATGATMLGESATYAFVPGRVYNLDGSAFIGGHSDIAGPEVAHLLWQAAAASRQDV